MSHVETQPYAADRRTPLLTTRGAADLLAVCQRTVQRLAERGELRQIRIGRAVRYSTAEVLALIEGRDTDNDRAIEAIADHLGYSLTDLIFNDDGVPGWAPRVSTWTDAAGPRDDAIVES